MTPGSTADPTFTIGLALRDLRWPRAGRPADALGAFLDHRHVNSRRRQVPGRKQPDRARADHDDARLVGGHGCAEENARLVRVLAVG
jgi:hypothetical protein